MMNRALTNSKSGKMLVFAGLTTLVAVLLAVFFLNGRMYQRQQETWLAEGYSHFTQNDFMNALESFKKAETTFGTSLSVFRTLAGADNHVTRNELAELTVSVCLAAAHERFFELDPAEEWVKKMQAQLETVKAGETKEELEALVKTAKEISGLCKEFASGNVVEAFKELKAVEDRALASDQDFFVFEIRFLIACGKALNEPIILNQARELLFFATTEAGIENDKTRRLWGILTN